MSPESFPWALVPALALCGVLAQAQPAKSLVSPPAQGDKEVPVVLGQSIIPLERPWKFQIGDSPIDPASHQRLWAEPGFDDSGWESVDITPQRYVIDPVAGTSGYVTGWTARGHKGYWGYAWYRIRVRLVPHPREGLALAGPADVDDAYQVFSDGILLGSFGDFSGNRPRIYYTRPMNFSLSPVADRPAVNASKSIVLAFRIWMEPNTLLTSPDAGGFHSVPVIGDAATIAMSNQMRWDEIARGYALTLAGAFLFLLLAVVSLSLVLFDRSDRVYFWMAGIFLLSAIDGGLGALDTMTQFLPGIIDTFLSEVFILPLVFVGWVMVWWAWFRLKRPTWLPRFVAVLACVYIASNLLGQGYFYSFISQPVGAAFQVLSWVVRLVCIGLLFWIAFEGIRQEGFEGWLVLPVVILAGISRFTRELRLLHIRTNWYPFGFRVRIADITNLLLLIVLALLLLRRLLLSVRRQRQMALDVKQAQEVQQVILPQARTVLPGFVVESEYRPAREVGGDFFQVIPLKLGAGLLIIAGDVTGKGLKAGMLVALLVGAIRSTAETTTEPREMLRALNRRLLGRGDAQATCLALRIDADGTATLANAGHVAPYLNGEEMEIEGSLPLGMIEDAEFSVMQFTLNDEDRLMLMSDGIAEATDANGKLFGFERIHELLRTAKSAAEVARAAHSFGQEDDISVISVTRTTMPIAVLA